MGAGLPPYNPAHQALLDRFFRHAARAAIKNPRNAGLTSGVTVTANGTTGAQANVYFHSVYPGFARVIGGTPYPTGSQYGRVYGAIIGATGGNIGTADGKQSSSSRIEVRTKAQSITFKIGRSTLPYRILVDDVYVDLTGTLTVASSPQSTYEFLTVDCGSRGERKITLEMQADLAFVECSVAATEKVYAATKGDRLLLAALWDSYGYGSNATALGDGIIPTMADWLGCDFTSSGAPGTGYTTGSGYNFGTRITNQDYLLGGTPDIVMLPGSYNDRNGTPATITANCLAGLRAIRTQLPKALIIVAGCFPGATGPSAGILAAEAAMLSAYNSFADPFSLYIPVSNDSNGAWITGTGTTAATTGTGNSDFETSSDAVHLNDTGCATGGYRFAKAIIASARALAA